jgi:hypothetical protein
MILAPSQNNAPPPKEGKIIIPGIVTKLQWIWLNLKENIIKMFIVYSLSHYYYYYYYY